MQEDFAEPDTGQRPAGGERSGSSDDDRQPDDAGAKGTLGESAERRPIPNRVSGSPRALPDLDPPRGKRAPKRSRQKPQEPPR